MRPLRKRAEFESMANKVGCPLPPGSAPTVRVNPDLRLFRQALRHSGSCRYRAPRIRVRAAVDLRARGQRLHETLRARVPGRLWFGARYHLRLQGCTHDLAIIPVACISGVTRNDD